MFVDARELEQGSRLGADLCVVGAGAAGIAIANALDGRGHRVVVLESGGFDRDAGNQRLYLGEHAGIDYPPLHQTRLRYFGGTTNHWAGWCRPPDPADLAGRSWIPASGWPIDADTLAPWLTRAEVVCDLEPIGFDPARFLAAGASPAPLDESVFETRVTRFSPPTRFARKYRERLSASGDVRVVLNANVVSFGVSADGGRVERLACRTLGGTEFSVDARAVVIATGGIENARLLLNASGPGMRGLGNSRDQVGRWFMDHFKFHLGTIELDEPGRLESYERGVRNGEDFKLVTGFAEEMLAAHAMSPSHIEFHPVQDSGGRRYRIDIRIDPAPNPDSRIVLDRVVDRFGMRRVIVRLAFTDMEKRTYAVARRLFARELARAGLGAVDIPLAGGEAALDEARVTATGFHHMGATRMSDDPRLGVVDRDCRMHDMDNLFVAGCSVFPGYEGYPTLTLVALALRLADHLDSAIL